MSDSQENSGADGSAAAPPSAVSKEMNIVEELVAAQELDKKAIENVLGEKGKQDQGSLELLYGETPPQAVEAMLDYIDKLIEQDSGCKSAGPIKEDEAVFVDVGSGRGHVVFAAAASRKYSKCIGIEVVKEHVDEAEKTRVKLEKEYEANNRTLKTPAANIEFICKDALKDEADGKVPESLKSAKLVYCFDMAFPMQMRIVFGKMFRNTLPDGAYLLVTHTDPLPSTSFTLVENGVFGIPMPWGTCPARLYRKGPGAKEQWLEAHGAQLAAARVPRSLWPMAFEKIVEQNMDIGQYVQYAEVDGTNNELIVISTKEMKPESTLFVIDHAWTFSTKQDALEALEKVPGLRERIGSFCAVKKDDKESDIVEACINQGILSSYSLVSDPSKPTEMTSTFFVLDEVGSRIRRRIPEGIIKTLQQDYTKGNLKFVTIFSMDYRLAFTVAWPVAHVKDGDILVADHELGWTDCEKPKQVLETASAKAQADSSAAAPLPEMKEFAAQAKLNEMLQKEKDASSS